MFRLQRARCRPKALCVRLYKDTSALKISQNFPITAYLSLSFPPNPLRLGLDEFTFITRSSNHLLELAGFKDHDQYTIQRPTYDNSSHESQDDEASLWYVCHTAVSFTRLNISLVSHSGIYNNISYPADSAFSPGAHVTTQ